MLPSLKPQDHARALAVDPRRPVVVAQLIDDGEPRVREHLLDFVVIEQQDPLFVAFLDLIASRDADLDLHDDPTRILEDLTVLEDLGDGGVVRAAGFFGNDWTLASGELVWADRQ